MRSLGKYFHAVSACVDDGVPVVLMFTGFVCARLECLGLFSKVDVVCMNVGKTGMDGGCDVLV